MSRMQGNFSMTDHFFLKELGQISQGFDPLLAEFLFIIVRMEKSTPVKGYPILAYQSEEPATGFRPKMDTPMQFLYPLSHK